ncbi:MAG: ORF2 protein [Anelloviridae sp.]|uniref:ORF2 protein n=1 Tax=Anelloviridae sp. TaxID=2055263 RepID=A0A3G2YSV4_9VIRU|nr:MAG: ORF2 protein [Anelloviridae sp.]AYP28724.1 MAG: ORF2 protein [Anelloviridae sp.]
MQGLFEYKRREALWKQACSNTHKIWCNCGQWQSHIQGGGSKGGDSTGGGDITHDTGTQTSEDTSGGGLEEDIMLIEEGEQRYYEKLNLNIKEHLLFVDGKSWGVWGVFLRGLEPEGL